jgi:hypothetical protein
MLLYNEGPNPNPLSGTYYVATNGNDTNSGSISAPFATFGNLQLAPGATIYVRGGTYNQNMYIHDSGTPTSPITISSYKNETPIIDGGYKTNLSTGWPTNQSSLIKVIGSNVIVSGFTVQRSCFEGVDLDSISDQAINITSLSNVGAGITITGSYDIASNCQVRCNSMENYGFTNTAWYRGLSANSGSYQALLISNKVWNNWGEGMSTYSCSNTTMIGNIVWDNKVEVYLSDCIYCLLDGNLIYSTPGNICSNGVSQNGILIGDELYNPSSSNNTIINNLVYGCYNNLNYWIGNSGGGLLNVLIANNTFANALSGPEMNGNLAITGTLNTNAVFENNIILQDKLTTSVARDSSAYTGLTFSHNLWSSVQPTALRGAGDIIANPLLVESGLTGPGQLSANWFLPLSNSPAIGAGVALTVVWNDFFAHSRLIPPSIGAIEGASQPQPPTDLHIITLP